MFCPDAYIGMSSISPSSSGAFDDQVVAIAALLDAHDLISVATIRADGWPQATSVGYMARWPDIYFVVARESQKFQNMARDPRISLCLGAATPSALGLDGLSMAALAEEVTDTPHIVQFDDAMLKRYPHGPVYNPASDAMALIRARLQLISLVRIEGGRSHSELLRVEDGRLAPA
jgi:general stress protein 26